MIIYDSLTSNPISSKLMLMDRVHSSTLVTIYWLLPMVGSEQTVVQVYKDIVLQNTSGRIPHLA
jgi:hypothetical protein